MNGRRLLMEVMLLTASLGVNAQTGRGSLHLFTEEARSTAPAVVFDFLERYLYQAEHSARGYDFFQRMAEEKVIVREGSLDNIKRLTPETPFSITRYEDRGYNVTWRTASGLVLLDMQFPIQYELLLGMPKVEIEKTMKPQLTACADTFQVAPPDAVVKKLDDGYYCTNPVANYYAESLNTATYYALAAGVQVPVYSSEQKWYSAANLFQGKVSQADGYRLHIEQNLYGFNKQTYTVKLSQWLNYCRKNGLIVYFGIEEERKDGLKALLIAQDKDLGYNHMMSIILPDNFTEKSDAVLKATLNAYIPTDNVKDLYKDYTEKKKKNK